jgi:hypothetical protein
VEEEGFGLEDEVPETERDIERVDLEEGLRGVGRTKEAEGRGFEADEGE